MNKSFMIGHRFSNANVALELGWHFVAQIVQATGNIRLPTTTEYEPAESGGGSMR